MNSVVSEWMDKQIWPQIYAMIVNDAYFRVFEHAREITGKFKGHIAQLVHDGYLTSQMIAIRRLCDPDRTVISLRRALIETKRNQPADGERI
jgi:L-lysine 2,3-aminomutase